MEHNCMSFVEKTVFHEIIPILGWKNVLGNLLGPLEYTLDMIGIYQRYAYNILDIYLI